ncbi:hypothetical protein EV363DRAFT_1075594, partial [Boletus edulis]
ESPMIPDNVGIETLCEVDWMVNTMVRAYKNKIVLENIDAIRLSERANKQSTFVQASDTMGAAPLQDITELAVIVDQSGVILTWYLPGTVSPPNQMVLWNNIDHLAHALLAGLNTRARGNWRTSGALYNMEANTKGVINMSPAWFQQVRH